jgi:hypothetical protein
LPLPEKLTGTTSTPGLSSDGSKEQEVRRAAVRRMRREDFIVMEEMVKLGMPGFPILETLHSTFGNPVFVIGSTQAAGAVGRFFFFEPTRSSST